ncbi:hypothetical protein [Calothrix sp. NIES-2098]|uniref:hypothetical protein n=1 Tax=Calothrix sp. NIES-2098 TaxID=1954171 RepID=UPI000B61755D|nr:hypothetical protein NIES2098_61150 [Calothrix sp. NIES-2098]
MLTKYLKRFLFVGTVVSIFLIWSETADACPVSSSGTSNLQTASENLMISKIQTFRGKLIYEKIPPVMSVQAYLGEEFFLITNLKPSSRLVLRPSEKVSYEKLQSLHQQEVEIRAVYVEGTRPASNEAACPLDSNGQCIHQGAGYKVLSIKLLSEL